MTDRLVYFERTDQPGGEVCRLSVRPDGVLLSGTILAAPAGAPLRVEYAIACGPRFETRRVDVAVDGAGGRRTLALAADGHGGWTCDGADAPALRGCADVDLGLTPSTNTLPIRRLGLLALAPGAAREVTAAWVGFPDLSVEPLPQRYTRLEGLRLRYQGLASRFVAELEVDADGLVVTYPPAWRRRAG